MDLLILALVFLTVLSLVGWGYGYRAGRPARGPAAAPDAAAGPAVWVHPVGILGLLLLVALLLLLFTGWRPVF
jgi:hypothetical protein